MGLESLEKTKDFLVCVDSDGCLLDNMELKHKECFCPATVNVWGLQGVSRYVREVAEFVNLYSRTRGTNRFPALVRMLELAYDRKELVERGYKLPDLTALKSWIETTPNLSAAALEEYATSHDITDPVLKTAAAWSREVDANIARIVRNISPFPYVKEALDYIGQRADIVVVSATPHEALARELTACGIAPLVSFIAGQEMGTKSECIRMAMKDRYEPSHVLKIGDAATDYKAASENGVLFRPIIPGLESESWKSVLDEGADRFFEGTFAGEYMDTLLDKFMSVLKETPPWEEG